MALKRVRTGFPQEEALGASRAVRAGNLVFVGATSALDENGDVLHPGDAAGQVRAALAQIQEDLSRAGAPFDRVVKTTLYVARREDVEAVRAAHAEVFGAHRPASAILLVAGFPDPGVLVQVEAVGALRDLGETEEETGAYIRRATKRPPQEGQENPFRSFMPRRSPP
ncbi:MAG TPA: Rid family hydrolase [Candidatus Thermoplasmatota archaeon]|nr:Rid family hydrolase [Candidatus Thermoplasmatota archaeon]